MVEAMGCQTQTLTKFLESGEKELAAIRKIVEDLRSRINGSENFCDEACCKDGPPLRMGAMDLAERNFYAAESIKLQLGELVQRL